MNYIERITMKGYAGAKVAIHLLIFVLLFKHLFFILEFLIPLGTA